MSRATLTLIGALGLLTSCAHQQKQPEPVAQPAPPPTPATPQLEAKPVEPPSVTAATELDQALRSTAVYFAFDRDQLLPEGMQALQKVADVLRKHKDLSVRVEGHCDERGTEEYNLALGHRRANAAAKYLRDLGVSEGQLDTISYGALRPAVDGHDEAAWSKNRRDELRRASN
ncbi:MAG: hypothetical protein AMXMBFR34_38720 [Myxococcaceae bacterium]